MWTPATTTVDANLLDRATRDRRRGSIGWLGVFVSLFIVVGGTITRGLHGTVAIVSASLFAGSVVLINWTRLWIKESREPFQYTFSVSEFEARAIPAGDHSDETAAMLKWLSRDLIASLGRRVTRLSLLDEPSPDASHDRRASHVHISGWYGIRRAAKGDRGDAFQRWQLEIVPQVRLGNAAAPAKQGQIVRIDLGRDEDDADGCPELSRDDYTGVLERVYWSVASRVYGEIGKAVEEKIALLPPGRLRASAYLREADDYAASNTLDAYAAARDLYRAARELYDLRSRPAPATPWRTKIHDARTWSADLMRRARLRLTEFVDGFGHREVMAARAMLGQATMMTAEWHLKLLCGTVPDEIFAVLPLTRKARRRLEALPEDVPERDEAILNAMLTEAIAHRLLHDYAAADKCLEAIRRRYPMEIRTDAEYLFVCGMNTPARSRAQRLLRQAADFNPTMERALFHSAVRSDELWRASGNFEPAVARHVDDQYRAVIAVDPGNINAWSNRGYIAWLLAEGHEGAAWRDRAFSYLEAGRQYKEVRREATVAELDWNLARLTAEAGKFAKAYRHYTDAVSAQFNDTPMPLDGRYFYESAGDGLVDRFRRYRIRVLRKMRKASADEARLAKSVMAFVFNDCGLALRHFYARSGNEEALEEAIECFREAKGYDEKFLMSDFNLADLHRELVGGTSAGKPEMARERLETAVQLLDEVLRQEPGWAPARISMVYARGELAAELDEELERIENASGPEKEQRAEKLDLERQRDACRAALVRGLKTMLPHTCLAGKIDAAGTYVKELVWADIAWREEFNEYHVDALIAWAFALASNRISARAAFELSALLRQNFYRADEDLLFAQRMSAKALQKWDGTASTLLLDRTVKECEELLMDGVSRTLTDDPAHHATLTSEAFAWLDEDKQLDCLLGALGAEPSPLTLLAVGQRLVRMDERGKARRVFEQVTESDAPAIAPIAFSELGELALVENRNSAARDAFAASATGGNPEWSPPAAIRAAKLFFVEGEPGSARALLARAATSDAEVGTVLGQMLEADPDLDGEAQRVYGAVVDSHPDDPVAATAALRLAQQLSPGNPRRERALSLALRSSEEPTLAEARLAKAETLLLSDGGRDEAEILLSAVLTSGSAETRSEAARLLAEVLAERGETDSARVLYEAAIESGPAWISLEAALDLGEIAEREGALDEARDAYRLAAKAHSWAALMLAEPLWDRGEQGDRDLAEELCELGGSSSNPDSLFAADARLLLGRLFIYRGKRKKAKRALLWAVQAGDLSVLPDAAVQLASLYESRGKPRIEAYLAALDCAAKIDSSAMQEVEAVSFVKAMLPRLIQEGELQNALAVAHAAAGYGPWAALQIGDMLERRGLTEQALVAYEAAAADPGARVEALLRQAQALSGSNREKAEDLYRNVMASEYPEAVADAERGLAELGADELSEET